MKDESSSSSVSAGGCPVKHNGNGNFSGSGVVNDASNNGGKESWLSRWSSPPWSSKQPRNQNQNQNQQSISARAVSGDAVSAGGSACPVASVASVASVVASVEEANRHAQTPQPDQSIPLSTVRTISSIPRTGTSTTDQVDSSVPPPPAAAAETGVLLPHHQQGTKQNQNWVYPSEQQFYNAMKRKGWDLPSGMEHTIPHVVRIHNAVNERGWDEIQQWERLRGNTNPTLVKFMGRPNDLSPRGFWNTYVLMKKRPFDRHDWIVGNADDVNNDNGIPNADNGETSDGDVSGGGGGGGAYQRRYVIDFYSGEEQTTTSKDNDNSDGGLTGLFSNMWQNNNNDTSTTSTTTTTSTFNNQQGSTNNVIKPPSMYLDVRPALDDSDALFERTKMFFKTALPGIYEAVTTTATATTSTTTQSQDSSSSKEQQS